MAEQEIIESIDEQTAAKQEETAEPSPKKGKK